ncbi:29511_t:CDS:1, partial [Gigaspora margarita]
IVGQNGTNEIIPLGPTEYEEFEVCQDNIICLREDTRIQSTFT